MRQREFLELKADLNRLKADRYDLGAHLFKTYSLICRYKGDHRKAEKAVRIANECAIRAKRLRDAIPWHK